MREYASIDDIFNVAAERGEQPFVVVCDEISDPHNLGAIIRSAECAGAHGVIIPKHRSAGLTAVVGKTSAGAAEYMAVARVASIAAALEELKKKGLWVYGTAADAPADLWQTKMTGPAALASVGFGMGRLVSEQCDFTVASPYWAESHRSTPPRRRRSLCMRSSASARFLRRRELWKRYGGVPRSRRAGLLA